EAAIQRQPHDLLVLDHGPETSGLRSHDRRISDDRHLFSNVADNQVEIDACFFAGLETNALTPHGLEPGDLDLETVIAGREARGGVDAVSGGHGDTPIIRSGVRDGDGRSRNGRPTLISDN